MSMACMNDTLKCQLCHLLVERFGRRMSHRSTGSTLVTGLTFFFSSTGLAGCLLVRGLRTTCIGHSHSTPRQSAWQLAAHFSVSCTSCVSAVTAAQVVGSPVSGCSSGSSTIATELEGNLVRPSARASAASRSSNCSTWLWRCVKGLMSLLWAWSMIWIPRRRQRPSRSGKLIERRKACCQLGWHSVGRWTPTQSDPRILASASKLSTPGWLTPSAIPDRRLTRRATSC